MNVLLDNTDTDTSKWWGRRYWKASCRDAPSERCYTEIRI